MMQLDFTAYLMISIFSLGYIAIIFERYLKINKTAISMIMATLTWGVLYIFKNEYLYISKINEQIGHASQIIFFLLGAITLVELIDSHQGFKIFSDMIKTRSKKKILWIIGFTAFFLSAILDNLTATIVLVSVLRKIIINDKDRLLLASAVVIAANAGGAWTPIGDVTTTMLWIKGHITSWGVIKSLFLPSLFSNIIALSLLGLKLKGNYPSIIEHKKKEVEPGATIVFFLGILVLLCVPVIHGTTGLPPFMAILIGLGFLWAITDIMHYKHEERFYLRVPHILTKVDSAAILFFLGILLSISSLEIIGVLKNLAVVLNNYLSNITAIATVIGVLSAIVDNVPLVAACTGMYDLSVYPINAPFWQMIAYAAGTGGSILIIGSAAGVALMGLEKIDFIWYLKKISLIAFISYLSGIFLYVFLNLF